MAKNEELLEEDQTISRCSTYQRATKEPSIEATASASAAAPNILWAPSKQNEHNDHSDNDQPYQS